MLVLIKKETMIKKSIGLFSIYCVSIYFICSCKYHKEIVSPIITKDTVDYGTDSILYINAKSRNNYTWYYLKDTLLSRSTGTGHPQPFFKTRFNSIAATKLNSQGRILDNAKFPEGSMIVKELILSDSSTTRFAIIYKQANSKNADINGWVWGYINFDGKVAIQASQKGVACISCHSQSESIDDVLMNKYFK